MRMAACGAMVNVRREISAYSPPMQRPALVILLSVFLSIGASLLVVTSHDQAVATKQESVSALSQDAEAVATADQWQALQTALDELTLEVARLQEHRGSERLSLAVAADAEAAEEEAALSNAMGSLQGGGAQFKAQVAEALTQIEEEREAVEFAEELEERREEAIEANAEYDTFNTDLASKSRELQDKLFLSSAQTADMRKLLALQNDRNREMTRLWSEGNTSEDELGEIFMRNRAEHRAEILALLPPGQQGTYRKYVREGGLGGRFSFFVAPWEEWKNDQN
jgi:hypothetical protein